MEIGVNAYTLFVNRSAARTAWARAWPILIGVIPGVAAGSYLLFRISPEWLRLATYAALLPLILFQAGGFRRPIGGERVLAVPFGTALGALYSVTTVSGPPLAVMLNNQGLVQQEFRATLGMIRIVEAVLTAFAYGTMNLYAAQTGRLLASILPSVLIGMPAGVFLARRTDPETFRRLCMSFDAWIVAFGLARALHRLAVTPAWAAAGTFAAVVLIDAWLLCRFFSSRRAGSAVAASRSVARS